MESEEYTHRMQTGINRLMAEANSFLMDFDWEDVPVVLAALQLATRHPEMPATVRQRLCQIIDGTIVTLETIAPEIGPALREGYNGAIPDPY